MNNDFNCVNVSVPFLPFLKRSALRKMSEGRNAFRRATLEKLHYSAENASRSRRNTRVG
jgi:hypothetical protein